MISTLIPVRSGTVPLTVAVSVALILFLVIRELANKRQSQSSRALSQHLLIFIIPLLMLFACTVIVASL